MRYKYFGTFFILHFLLFTACSSKITRTVVTNNITAFTVGDYELTQVTKELSANLSIPIHEKKLDSNQRKSLDELTLIKVDNALCLIIPGNIFNDNKAYPIENAIYVVQEITDILKKYPHIIIQVTGHTDKNEKSKHPQELSDNRAITIAEIFYARDTKNEIFAKGCAQNKPIFTNIQANKRFSNARIEIYLYANKEKMLDPCK